MRMKLSLNNARVILSYPFLMIGTIIIWAGMKILGRPMGEFLDEIR